MFGQFSLLQGILRVLLISRPAAGFFNVRGTWHLSQHDAPLWFAVRFSVLQPDYPGIQDDRAYPIAPPGAHIPVA